MTIRRIPARAALLRILAAMVVAVVGLGSLPERVQQAEPVNTSIQRPAHLKAVDCANGGPLEDAAQRVDEAAPKTQGADDTADVSSAGGPARLDGRWKKLTRSPFKAEGALGVWTGSEMLVLAAGRTAGYDPQGDRWRRLSDAPVRIGDASHDVAVWADAEWLVWTRDGTDTHGFGFKPRTNEWRRLPEAPLVDPIVAGVRADGEVVVVTSSGESASYDTSEDCWWPLARVDLPDADQPSTAETRPRSLFWTGRELLLTTWQPPFDRYGALGRSKLWSLASEAARWVDTGPTPLIGGWPGGLWTGEELMFLGGPRDESGTSAGAAYDPDAGIWREFRQACGPETRDATWTGELLISQWSALEPADLTCYRVPTSDDRRRYGAVTVWTGDELIIWSGGRGEGLSARPDGVRFQPADKSPRQREEDAA